MMFRDLCDDGDSQEEMDAESLGAHKGNIVNGIRYSARVQEKQEKLRRESSPSKQMVADSTTTVAVPMPCQSTSVAKVPLGEENADIYPCESTFISQPLNLSGEKKKKRTWELWSQEDKQLFFEALNESGKDFDAIQNYLASKLKPRSKGSCSQTVPKNKDQVRHFYYRTWNKISKYLTFPKDMKKAYQELYGLINYGELRKKQRVLNLKTAVKLSELVERGTTTIKVRGKTFRIKTPVCRALKKLNRVDDVDHIRVPCKLCVELIPHDGNTWASVQRVSHNPRVKVFVPLQRTLSSLIAYFEERWKTDQSRLKEEFSLTVFGKPRTRLRFIPVENRDLSVPTFKFSEVTSATKISLSSYVQNCLSQEGQHSSVLVSKKFKRKPKHGELDSGICLGNNNQRESDYLATEGDVSDADGYEPVPENQFRITLRRDKPPCGNFRSDYFGDQENSNGFPDNALWSVHEENANAAAETDPGETDYAFDENMPSPTECDENSGDDECLEQGMQDNVIIYGLPNSDNKDDRPSTCIVCKSAESDENDKQDKICTCEGKKAIDTEGEVKCQFLDPETLARGWNVEEAANITLGEIYLMLGKSDRLCFEYVWDKSEEDKLREERSRNLVEKLVGVARQLKKRKTNRAKTIVTATSTLLNNVAPVCSKCSLKLESPVSNEGECLVSSGGAKENCESPQYETPHRVFQQPTCDSGDENKITLHAAIPSAATENSPNANFLNKIESVRTDPSPTTSNENQEIKSTTVTSDSETVIMVDEPPNPQNTVSIEIVTNVPDTTSNSSINMCSTKLSAAPSGIIDITPVTSNSSSAIDSGFRRGSSNVQATIIPATSTAIIRSVALTSCSLTDVQTSSLSGCHSTTLASVATTTPVLLTEPLMYPGLATESSPSYIPIQPKPCSSTTESGSPSLPLNTQDGKFRRPADLPALTKANNNNEDRSSSEDSSTKVTVPKPFLDLPKGNRRIGRRPAWKQRVIIPRMLPLLPKLDESMIKSATMATLITIPPVVATGLSVLPVSTDTPMVATLPTSSDVDMAQTTAGVLTSVTITSVAPGKAVSAISSSSVTVTTVPSNLIPRDTISVSGATSTSHVKCGGSKDSVTSSSSKEKSSTSKSGTDPCLHMSSRSGSGFEESLDNLSLSSFMDISIPESTRFIASDLRLEDLECSNSSMSLGGLLDENRKVGRETSLLDTPPKKQPRMGPFPSQSSMDTNWNDENIDSSDLFMGGLFTGNEGLPPTSQSSDEPLTDTTDFNFQSVMGDNSLGFDDDDIAQLRARLLESNKE